MNLAVEGRQGNCASGFGGAENIEARPVWKPMHMGKTPFTFYPFPLKAVLGKLFSFTPMKMPKHTFILLDSPRFEPNSN